MQENYFMNLNRRVARLERLVFKSKHSNTFEAAEKVYPDDDDTHVFTKDTKIFLLPDRTMPMYGGTIEKYIKLFLRTVDENPGSYNGMMPIPKNKFSSKKELLDFLKKNFVEKHVGKIFTTPGHRPKPGHENVINDKYDVDKIMDVVESVVDDLIDKYDVIK
jgi:hypothetical protein